VTAVGFDSGRYWLKQFDEPTALTRNLGHDAFARQGEWYEDRCAPDVGNAIALSADTRDQQLAKFRHRAALR
jgi:hypothetical protein